MNKTFSGGGTKVSRFVAEAELRSKNRGFPNEEEQERKRTGGFWCVPVNKCDDCCQYKSKNGACGCV